MTTADCALAAALQFARYAEFSIEAEYDNILRWDLSYRARQAAKTVLVL